MAAVARQEQHHLTAAEDVQIAFAYQAGRDMKSLAAQFGVHRHTIAACLRRLAVPLRRQGLQHAEVPEAARLYLEGWSLFKLGEKFGCDPTVVRRAFLAHGVQIRPRPGWKH